MRELFSEDLIIDDEGALGRRDDEGSFKQGGAMVEEAANCAPLELARGARRASLGAVAAVASGAQTAHAASIAYAASHRSATPRLIRVTDDPSLFRDTQLKMLTTQNWKLAQGSLGDRFRDTATKEPSPSDDGSCKSSLHVSNVVRRAQASASRSDATQRARCLRRALSGALSHPGDGDEMEDDATEEGAMVEEAANCAPLEPSASFDAVATVVSGALSTVGNVVSFGSSGASEDDDDHSGELYTPPPSPPHELRSSDEPSELPELSELYMGASSWAHGHRELSNGESEHQDLHARRTASLAKNHSAEENDGDGARPDFSIVTSIDMGAPPRPTHEATPGRAALTRANALSTDAPPAASIPSAAPSSTPAAPAPSAAPASSAPIKRARRPSVDAVAAVASGALSTVGNVVSFGSSGASEDDDDHSCELYKPDVLCLYLNRETFGTSPMGRRLAEEVRAALKCSVPVLLLHENDPSKGGTEFNIFFHTTPDDLINGGLFFDIAIPLYFSPRDMAVSREMALKALRKWEVTKPPTTRRSPSDGHEPSARLATRSKTRRTWQAVTGAPAFHARVSRRLQPELARLGLKAKSGKFRLRQSTTQRMREKVSGKDEVREKGSEWV